MYVLAGCTPKGADELRGRLEELGESVAIAAATDAGYSVHVHTDDAGAAIEAALRIATPSRIQISSLQAGPSGAAPASWSRDRAVLAVAAPILSEGDVLGCVLFVAAHGDGPAGETERKLAQAVSGFLGKQMES